MLASFFEPTDDERGQGIKVPGEAHRAIARLVSRGAIRVIVTTNFDRLIEQALEAEGVSPQVISTPGAIEGMEPLTHARCTVIKLHGDYARIDTLNTLEELSSYNGVKATLLDRVLDEYGLVVNGWSGDWDIALVDAIERVRNRRYPMYWATYSEPGEVARRLVAQHRSQVIKGAPAAADKFFPDLVNRLEALDSLVEPPLTKAMAIAHLKRIILDETKFVELRDLFVNEVDRLRNYIAGRGQILPDASGQALQDAHDEIVARCDTMLNLLAHGVYLDRNKKCTDLWVWVIEQLMRARLQPDGAFHEAWVALHHYPALLALKVGCLAAVAAKRDDVLVRLLREPAWIDPRHNNEEAPALYSLDDRRVLGDGIINSFPRWGNQSWIFPQSHYLRETLQPIISQFVGDQGSYKQLFNRTEYRIALTQGMYSAKDCDVSPGEFVGEWQWAGDTLAWETDFRKNADYRQWGWSDGVSNDTLADLSDILKKIRRWH
jgi:hypothetical protein